MSKRFSIIGDIIAEFHGGDWSPGGSGAIAIAIAKLGGTVKLRSVIATDEAGHAIQTQLKRARIHPGLTDRIDDVATSVIRRDDDGAVLNRTPGIGIVKGAVMDIYDLFGHDAMILDTRDQPLRRFITDLPAHTDGNVRMVGTLNHLDWQEATDDEFEIAMRCDAIVGTPSQYARLTGETTPSDALGFIFDEMPGTHLRAAVAVTPDGVELIARDERILRPVQEAVPDLLLPQVVAGIAWGLAHRWRWDKTADVSIDPSMTEG